MLHLLIALIGIAAPPSPQQNIPIMWEGSIICSSVLVDEFHVLTAAHCIQDPLMDVMCGTVMTPGLVVRFDERNDLAEFELVESCGQPITPVAKVNPKRGDKAYTLGCPAGICGRLSVGIVSGYSSISAGIFAHQVLVTDAMAWFGNSGGGLFDDEGQVIGICSTGEPHSRPDGSFAVLYTQYIPASTIQKFLVTKENVFGDNK